MSSSLVVRTPGRVLVGVLVLVGVVVFAPVAGAAESHRLGGENRFDTARLIAGATFDASATDVILATGFNYPDALASAGLAGTVEAPVLLTGVDDLPDETVAALQALSPTTVHIAGGPAAVSQAVEDELDAVLEDDFTVERYEGANRYETAALIAADVPAAGNTAIIATGQNFPDAVAGGPLAYAGPHPVLLVTRDSVPQVTENALRTLGITDLIILGETAAINADVEAALETIVGSEAERRGGERRAETAVAIAEYAVEHHGFDLDDVLIANGWQNLGVDALAGGPHGGVLTAPILMVEEDDVPPATAAFLEANATSIDTVRALGGTAVIDKATLDEATALATAAPGSTPALEVRPSDAVTLEVIPGIEADDDEDARAYSVHNAAADAKHTIALFPAAAVSIDSGGAITFADETGDGIADGLGQVSAGIVGVNGVSSTGYGQAVGVAPVGEEITFVVDGATPESVVPVVFVDADSDGDLDLNSSGAPAAEETAAIGGTTRYIAEEAQPGASGPVTVDESAGDWFTDGSASYYFDDNDTFRVAGDGVSYETFLGALSPGDTVTVVDYRPEPGVSIFDLTDDIAGPPTGVTAVAADVDSDGAADDVEVSWTASAGGVMGSYTVSVDLDCDADGVFEDVTGTTADDATTLELLDLPDGSHCLVVTGTTVAGSNVTERSESAEVLVDAVEEIAPTITSAGVEYDANPIGGVTTGDRFRFEFSEPMGAEGVASWTFDLTDTDGDLFVMACTGAAVTDSVSDAQCLLGDGDDPNIPSDTLEVMLLEPPKVVNIDGDGVLQYPLTITAAGAGVVDADTGTRLDVENSADVSLG